jgi:ketosteroid isomerase-like protein
MSREPKHGVATTAQDVLTHHSNSFGDIDSTMADFTAESKLFTPEGLLRGPEAIRGFFEQLFAEFAKPGASFEMLREQVDGDTAYIVWTAETADNRYELGTDTYIVQNGKIVTQTFAAKVVPKR